MIQNAIDRLEQIIASVPEKLNNLDETGFATRPAPGKWSKKEILGHLTDSAANNHQRFIRAQFEDAPAIWYEQDQWVAKSNYQDIDKDQLVNFWLAYNRHLLHIIRNIPAGQLENTCIMKDGTSLSLDFLVIDYVRHLEHHLEQIFPLS